MRLSDDDGGGGCSAGNTEEKAEIHSLRNKHEDCMKQDISELKSQVVEISSKLAEMDAMCRSKVVIVYSLL